MPEPEIVISKISSSEVELLQAISILTFTETFSNQNSEADMQKYILEQLSIEKLTAELNTIHSEFYFLKVAQQIIGYLKLNTGAAQTELQGGNSLEIERIYLANKYHGEGLGNRLLQTAIDIAKQKQSTYIWLGVWEENHRAISFYQKNGFVQFDTHIFKLGEDEQTDILMRLELN